MTPNWSKLRAWDGSQYLAFEELCCQLAASESPCLGAKFYRKGTPDAGVECFWRLPNGEEHGWQAKFFLSSPTAGQWAELDKSVKTALNAHPRLTRYTVCFPINRSDPRGKGRAGFLPKWDKRVTKWKRLASEENVSVSFEYWGETEIFLRLSREEHSGRRLFWFGDQQFSLDWFRTRLEEAIANAGARYTPELNVALPIANYFEALGRSRPFFNQILDLYRSLKDGSRSVLWCLKKQKELQDEHKSLDSATTRLIQELDTKFLTPYAYPWEDPFGIDWKALGDGASTTIEVCEQIRSKLRILQERKNSAEKTDHAAVRRSDDPYREESSHVFRLTNLLGDLADFCAGETAGLANNPALLLVGEAGRGKTHLLCDIAEQGLAAGRPRILLHGSHFENGEPWSQITRELGLIAVCTFRGDLVFGCRVTLSLSSVSISAPA